MHNVFQTVLPAQSITRGAGLPRTGQGDHHPGTPYKLETVHALTYELTLMRAAHSQSTAQELTPHTLRGDAAAGDHHVPEPPALHEFASELLPQAAVPSPP